MPVIIVGADTPTGARIIEGFLDPRREIRAFVSDQVIGGRLRESGVKVALGDVSDGSHIQGAATRCFSAVLVTEAARDGRKRSFARTEEQVLSAWAKAVAGVKRVIWVYDGDPPPVEPEEVAIVSATDPDLVAKVLALDDAASL